MDQISEIVTEAETEGKMTESMCMFWLELLSDVQDVDSVLQYASDILERFPNNVELWQKYLVSKTETSG